MTRLFLLAGFTFSLFETSPLIADGHDKVSCLSKGGDLHLIKSQQDGEYALYYNNDVKLLKKLQCKFKSKDGEEDPIHWFDCREKGSLNFVRLVHEEKITHLMGDKLKGGWKGFGFHIRHPLTGDQFGNDKIWKCSVFVSK